MKTIFKKLHIYLSMLKSFWFLLKSDNIFYRIIFPFDRRLIDPRNKKQYPIEYFKSDIIYNAYELSYEVNDPKDSSKRIVMQFKDSKSFDISKFYFVRLNADNIDLRENHYTGKISYIYRFEEDFYYSIKRGNLEVVNITSTNMLKAVAKNQDFLFNDATIFHFSRKLKFVNRWFINFYFLHRHLKNLI